MIDILRIFPFIVSDIYVKKSLCQGLTMPSESFYHRLKICGNSSIDI